MNKKILIAAAISGLIGNYSLAADKAAPKKEAATCECHGINECKGKGECGGPGWSCAGKNPTKESGWIMKTIEECHAVGGTCPEDKTKKTKTKKS